MLLAVRFLFGIGEAGAYPNISIALSKWLPAFERGKGQALIWAASRIGAGLTPILVIPIQQKYGWQMSFYILGGVGLLWVIFWIFWYKEEPSEAKDISKEELNFILENRQLSDHSPKQSVWKILNHTNLWILFLMYYCYAAGAYFFQSWMPKYLQQGRGISEENMKFMASAPFILGAVGCFLGGVLSDYTVKKYGKKWGRRIVPMIGLGLSGICLITACTQSKRYFGRCTFVVRTCHHGRQCASSMGSSHGYRWQTKRDCLRGNELGRLDRSLHQHCILWVSSNDFRVLFSRTDDWRTIDTWDLYFG